MINDILVAPSPSPTSVGREMLWRSLGKNLPAEYLTWVEQYGGSSTSENLVMPDANGNALLELFYDAEIVASNYVARGGFSRNVPKVFVVVGYGPGGGLCLAVHEGDFGSVWFADYDLADQILGEDESPYDDDSELPQIMVRLADNWASFIESR